MPAGLDPSVAAKLVKIAGLLGSDHDGERSAAAWQATRLLRAQGMTWQDVFASAPAVIQSPARPQAQTCAAHVAAALSALQLANRLNNREREFLVGISRRQQISPKQMAWLNDILRKLRQGGAA